MLDSAKLRLQQADFLAVAPEVAASVAQEAALNEAKLPKLTEQERAEGQTPPRVPAKLTLFWRLLASRSQHADRLSEWDRLSAIAMVMVGTSVADERTFSYTNYVTEQRPSLATHLEVVVMMAEQTMFGLGDFPLDERASCGWRRSRGDVPIANPWRTQCAICLILLTTRRRRKKKWRVCYDTYEVIARLL